MRKFIIPFFIFAGAFAYYVLQACSTFYFWDSAELTAAVLTGGVPHPPGFPFVLFLAKAWVWLLPFDPAFSLNLFSTFWAALGLGIWYQVILRLIRESGIKIDLISASFFSFLAILIMGVSLTYSIQAVRFEVYSLNFLLFGVIVSLIFNIFNSQNNTILSTMGLFVLTGFFVATHSLTALLALLAIFISLAISRKSGFPGFLAGILGMIVLSTVLYLYIYYLASQKPFFNWGDPSGPTRFLNYLFVREFQISLSSFSFSHIAQNFKFVFDVLSNQLGILGLLFSLFGFLFIRKTFCGIMFALLFIFNLFSPIFSSEYFYENYDLHGYLVISLALLTAFLALSFCEIFAFLHGRNKKEEKYRFPLRSFGLTLFLSLIVVVNPIRENLFSADLSDVDSAEKFAQSFLEKAPQKALIVTSSYNTYFCLLALEAADSSGNSFAIFNLYNWDHLWGRKAVCEVLDADLPMDVDRQTFYRNFLNYFMKRRPVYVEYDVSSRPICKYLKPYGLGYLFDFADTVGQMSPAFAQEEASRYLKKAEMFSDIETIRTWTLWFSSRGEYWNCRGGNEVAQIYFSAVESLASKAKLK